MVRPELAGLAARRSDHPITGELSTVALAVEIEEGVRTYRIVS
jgi:hypothetical protein